MMTTNLILLALSLLVLSSISNTFVVIVDASYAISIEPDDEECYIFMTPTDVGFTTIITGSYEVLNDDVDSYELAVKVSKLDNGESLYESPAGIQEGDFTLENIQSSSKFSICFQNNADNDDVENEFDVGFNVRFDKRPTRTLDDKVSGPDGERASQLIDKAAKIHQNWNTLQDHFDFLRNREGIHYHMNEEIMNRLSRWTYIEAFLVIAMSVGQVMYWKKFFEKRRYL
mmetsp:Transcript_35007/g.39091  ORF Transcript_35007/g.39091 Transcript_35007/m.39091 type:complete len:229 (+) Transcript_35007:88-774(+)